MSNSAAKVDTEEVWDLSKVAATLDEKRRAIFLRELATNANPLKAARAAGYNSTAPINRAMGDDPHFADQVADATRAAADAIESEAVSRAMDGVEQNVWFKGEICGTEMKKSDSLLETVLKAAKPDKYAQKKDIKHTHEGNIGVAVIPITAPNLEDWERASIDAHYRQSLLTDPSKIIDTTCTEISKPTEIKRS